MRQNLVILSLLLLATYSDTQAKATGNSKNDQLYFIENKGQIRDQQGNLRDDIQFSLQGQGVSVFVGNGQIHYQFSKAEKIQPASVRSFDATGTSGSFETYRMDVQLVDANLSNGVIAEEKQSYYENYYITSCPVDGIHAGAYNKITYKDIYPNIDWQLYVSGNRVKHQFIVRPGGDVSAIRLRYSGQTALKINNDGSITATTPMGQIKEQAPECYSNGDRVSSSFHLDDNTLSYRVGRYNGTLIIDPVVAWGTYYGTLSNVTNFTCITYDDSGHLYTGGYTTSTTAIATTGSFQNTNNGNVDGVFVKFDSSGNRLWATYYGGFSGDIIEDVACDHSGNVYIAGNSSSTTDIATPGSFQPALGAGPSANNSFLARFNSAGARIWGTYMGGTGSSLNQFVTCDTFGGVYLSGVTGDATNIATASGFQPARGGARDCFLVKFDSVGRRIWGTYYGGAGDDFGGTISSDGKNVYLSGYTSSTSDIASAGAYQPALRGGGTDAFVAKFDSSGNRLWGTYYGGEQAETVGGLTYSDGVVYLLGATGSDSGIATTGSYQPTRGGNDDAFLVRFDALTGQRKWATYYGGSGTETVQGSRLISDNSGNVCIVGYTDGTSGLGITNCGPQVVYGGGPHDGFAAKYDSLGRQLWSTYYGGSGEDVMLGGALRGPSLFFCGYTNSTDSIATPGSFLNSGGGSSAFFQGMLGKISDDAFFYTHSDTTICVHSASAVLNLHAHAGRNYNWFDGDTASSRTIDSAGIYRVAYTFNCQRVVDTMHVFYNVSDTPCSAGFHGVKTAENKVTIFPDPASSQCTVSFTEHPADAQIILSDMTGRLTRMYKLGQSTVISLADIPSGLYECRITFNGEMVIKKLVIIK